MKIRNFRLMNNDGETYDLTTREHFLHSPSGLGYSKDMTYQRLGDLYVVLDEAFAQGQVMGEVFFPQPNAYNKYFDFIRFCQNAPLYLMYRPTDREYIKEVRVVDVQKTELSAGGLNIVVTMDALSLFYRQVNIMGEQAPDVGGKVYDYKYDYVYNDSVSNTIAIDIDSYAESPVKIYIYGEAVNPTWRHYVNNVLHATGGVTGTIPQNQMLCIDTTRIPYTLNRVDLANEIVADMYAASDFSTERFIFLEHGDNRISVSHDGTNDLVVTAEAHVLYASV